jgi:IS605 OrfB family transposase
VKKERVFTYQTEIVISEEEEQSISSMAQYLSFVERRLFAEYSKGKSLFSCKNTFLKKYKISARHFNALCTNLEGKISSLVALNEESIANLRQSIRKTDKNIKNLQSKIEKTSSVCKETLLMPPDLSKEHLRLHIAQRKKLKMEHKLSKLVQDQKESKVRLCFGSKKLFHKQFHLKENQYSSHEEWKRDWEESRNNAFFTLGSKDESAGNQTCQLFVQENGLLGLHLRLCDALITQNKYVTLKNIAFAYGDEVIRKSIESCKIRAKLKNKEDPSYALYGRAISCRFKRKAPGRWTLFVTTSMNAPTVTTKNEGAVGIDINSDHLAFAEIDAQGNPIHKGSIFLSTYGKSRGQTQAIIGDAVTRVMNYAKSVGKPVALEDLDFSQKKEKLSKTFNVSHNRMLSSFAYSSIIKMTESQGYRKGVEVFFVNPAFTSVMGRVKYAIRYGLSVHQSAALCIARRKVGFVEKIPSRLDHIPDGKGDFIALALPVKECAKPKKISWDLINKKLKAELAAHFRTKRNRSQNKTKDLGKPNPKFTEEARYANR